MNDRTDVVVVGAGLAGLVAATELGDAGRRVVVVDQEGENSLGGQAWWSLGGLFLVDSPEQRRLGIHDSRELALQDWMGTARFDRPEDEWPRRTAEAFIEFAAGEMRPWLHAQGMRWFPVPGWAERGGVLADGHGNSVPRFHVTWGTGPGVLAPFVRRVRAHVEAGRVELRFRHRVTRLLVTTGRVEGVAGEILAPAKVARGRRSNRDVTGAFELGASAVIVASGGLGANLELVRRHWPVDRLGPAPAEMLSGVPHHVDGRMLDVSAAAGAALVNTDRMWHYTEGVGNWSPIWPNHGIRILSGPSPIWIDARGDRLPPPCLPGFDTPSTLQRILSSGHTHSWFVLNRRIAEKEIALSGSEQNPDLTSGGWWSVLRQRLSPGPPGPVQKFLDEGEDWLTGPALEPLVERMNALAGDPRIDPAHLRAQIEARDREIGNPFSKDAQVVALRGARRYLGDRFVRTARPHRILDPRHGPLVAVRLRVLTRKCLGGIHVNLDGQALDEEGRAIPGLYAVGEVAGFGGGGYHGYGALEGTFLGGCIFGGRRAGRHAARHA
jgi:predicted oxidoreductase